MSYFIGIDIGTGSTKAVAVNTTGEPLKVSQASYPTIAPHPTYSEQDPLQIWDAFVSCLAELITQCGEPPAGVALSSAMHSVIPISESGVPLMNMITWADNRSASIAIELHETSLGEKIYSETGTPLHAMTPVCKIKWLAENGPALFKQSHKFISIKEFVWFKLFGVYEADYSIASATGLFDINKLTWHKDAMEFCGITTDRLSEPVDTSHFRSGLVSTLPELAPFQNIPFYIGASDGCMANLGSFAVSPGIAALTIGTSGAIRVASAKPTVNFDAMTFNYLLTKGVFISGGPINNGGVILKWYAQSFLQRPLETGADYDALLSEITSIHPGSEGLIFLPYLLGERAPLWDSEACGAFFGIRNFHTQAHFTRAVIEGISMALFSIAAAMETSGLHIEQIHVSGGFVHSEEWLQILADIFNKKICLINAEDASAVGAAYLAFRCSGTIDNYTSLQPKEDVTYLPNPQRHEIYKGAFAVFEKLYRKLKPEMHLIRNLNSFQV